MIDYDKLPIRCRVCLSWKHKANDCKELQKRPVRGREKLTQPQNIQHQEKGKNVVVDQEGFQQVRRRRNTRWNIFENNQDMGQDIDGRGASNIQPFIFGAVVTAATQNTMTKGQTHSAPANTDLPNLYRERTAEDDNGLAVITAGKCGSSAVGKDDQQCQDQTINSQM